MLERIIKIPGKTSFTELSLSEIALMIRADSSICKQGNSSFASCALDEFLHFSDLGSRPDLEKIRTDILDQIYLSTPSSTEKSINVEFLKEYSQMLETSSE